MNSENLQRSVYYNENLRTHFVRLTVCPTTGGKLQLSISVRETIVGLKCTLAKKLRLRAECMSLLHKDRLLVHGNLVDNRLCDGSQLTLVPNMETGTTSMVPDSRVMQALENLSESQVNDFLTGRAPLLLAMKLGEHMMFVQLQLSASSCSTRRRSLHGQPPSHCSSHASSTTQKENVKCFCNHPPQCGVPGGHTAAGACGVPAGHTSGAVIDSVNQIGQGIYSGTFSGTLDPTIQDSRGKPKRDINTILQILNDLLVASPQFQQSQAMHTHHVNHSENKMSSNSQTCLGQPLSQSPLEANEDSLRGKVQSLQKMMHERKLRRQEKRGLRAPYQWSDRRSSFNRRVSQSSHAKFDSQLGREHEVASKQTENITSAETPYSTTSTTTTMEHESVLV